MSDYQLPLLVDPNDENANATLRHFYSANNYCADDMELTLMDGSDYHVSASELFTALQVLTSEWFSELVKAHNLYERYMDSACITYSLCIDNPTNHNLYELAHISKFQGKYRAKKEMYEQLILTRVTLQSWCMTKKIYETLYQIPRDRI